MWRLCPLLAALSIVLVSPLAQAQMQPAAAQAEQRYQALIDQALLEFGRAQWAEARALFAAAHALTPNARTLRGMAMADFNLRAYERTVAELEAALDEPTRALDPPLRAQVEELLGRAQTFVSRYTLIVRPASALLIFDGLTPVRDRHGRVLLGLGRHVLRASAVGHRAVERTLEVHSWQDETLLLDLPDEHAETIHFAPVERSSSVRPWAWGSTIAAVALLAIGAGTWFTADQRYAEAKRMCPQGCVQLPESARAIPALESTSYATWAVGGALGITAVVLWTIKEGDSPSKPPGTTSYWPGARASGSF